jgi:DNA-binding transcriptional LysR family regulator
MDLYQLRYFLEVARERSFARAAENLGVSSPAVSKSVALLERSIGRRLLSRSTRKVELTLDGERLLGRVQRVFDELEEARLELAGLSAADPAALKIGSREMITNYLMPAALAGFRERHPATRFGLYELGPRELGEALKKDLVDFGFHYEGDLPDPALETRRLGFLPSHIYASRALLPGGRVPKSFDAARALPFVAPRYFRADPSEPSPDGYPDQRHPRRIQYEGEFLETHRRFVLDGLAAAVLPDFTMREDLKAGRAVRLPGPELGRSIHFYKRRGRRLPPAVDEFVARVEAAIRRLGGRGA